MKSHYKVTHAVFGLCLSLGLVAQTPQRQDPPPEYAEYTNARSITDVQARIKEFRRLKAAYPNSSLIYEIDKNLLDLVTNDAVTLDKLLAAQRDVIKASRMRGRFFLISSAANMILDHKKLADFPKTDVLKAIQDYKAEAIPLLEVREAYSTGSREPSGTALNNYKNLFEIPLVKALIINGKAQEAMDVLERYGKAVSPDAGYYVMLGDVYIALKRDKDALDAYLEAAASIHPVATAKAKALYAELNGPNANFENALEQRKAQRPFQPPPFKAPENWKGKTVLAEVFTGSECGPCVAAAFAFDALEETYPTQYLAVLKYHLPVPNYDPMMNPATKKRDDYYGRGIIGGAPTVILNGVKASGLGGSRFSSSASFYTAKREIDTAMGAAADITINAVAVLNDDNVKVDCEFSKALENAEYNVVLVQTQEEFRGGNGILHHNMVVRDLKTVTPSERKASVTFNIIESEKAADAHLAEWAEKASERQRQGSKWPAKRNRIDRNNLKAVIFVQDKNTKKVYNAFVADVAIRQA